MLVTGGWDIIDMKTHKTKRFDSTELLVPGARSWRLVGALPMPMSGMHHSLATLNNQVFLFGEKALWLITMADLAVQEGKTGSLSTMTSWGMTRRRRAGSWWGGWRWCGPGTPSPPSLMRRPDTSPSSANSKMVRRLWTITHWTRWQRSSVCQFSSSCVSYVFMQLNVVPLVVRIPHTRTYT